MALAIGGIMAGVQGLTSIASGIIGSGGRKREQRQAQADFDRRQGQFENLDTSNVYAGLENVYEDLTVNQQQAQFQAQQGNQQRANIMQNMKGAAGGSGIAGLAQLLANQGQ